jgi:hypothetical protein
MNAALLCLTLLNVDVSRGVSQQSPILVLVDQLGDPNRRLRHWKMPQPNDCRMSEAEKPQNPTGDFDRPPIYPFIRQDHH